MPYRKDPGDVALQQGEAGLQEQLQPLHRGTRGFKRHPVHTFPVNEAHHQREILRGLAPREGAREAQIHAGVAGFFNFDMAAKANSDGIILMDNNINQVDFWRSLVPVIAAVPDPVSFRAAFASRVQQGGKFRLRDAWWAPYVPLRFADVYPGLEAGAVDFLGGVRWIREPEWYAHIHALAARGRIASVTMDITDKEQCSRLKQAVDGVSLDGRKAVLANVYASNVYDLQQMHPSARLMPLMFALWREEKGAVSKERLEDLLVDQFCAGEAPKHNPRWHRRKAAIHASLGAVQEVVEAYRLPFMEYMMHLEAAPKPGASREALRAWLDRPRKQGCEVAQQLYQRLLDHPKLDDRRLLDMGMIAPNEQYVHGMLAVPQERVSYTPLRALAGPDTQIYCTSSAHHPLVVFEGPESPAASWRDKLRAERVQGMQTMRADDRMIG